MIQSMTAFAEITKKTPAGCISWEIRTVNHRYFDCSLRLPEPFRQLEAALKLKLQRALERGRVECTLKFSPENSQNEHWTLNTKLVHQLLNSIQEIEDQLLAAGTCSPQSEISAKNAPGEQVDHNWEPQEPNQPTDIPKSWMVRNIDPMKLLTWPGVIQSPEENHIPTQELVKQIFDETLEQLLTVRHREGHELGQLIIQRIQELQLITANIQQKIPQLLADQRSKLERRLAEITVKFDQSRLEQEIVYLAQKTDITEELDRLGVHAEEVIRLIHAGNTVGKRLDFLMQELNRESNTLASKSTDSSLTQAAVELKVLIEQMREQIQNLA